jgi:LysM repeat protein
MYKIYKVVSGDSLESIAKKFNTTINNLQEINDKEYISVGDLIIVPNNTNNNWFNTYVVKKGDNLYSIAQKNNISLNDLIKINGLEKDDYIYPNQEIMIPKDNIKVVITEDKDTINTISKKLGLSSEELLYQNPNIFLLSDQLLINKR